MESQLPIVSLLGRVLLATIFVMSGLGKIPNFAGTAEFMSGEGMPMPQLLLVCAMIIEIGGGLAVMAGFFTRIAGAVLLLFLVVATYYFHDFWTFPAEEQQDQIVHFLKNLSIAGGVLLLTASGPGRFGLDAWRRRATSRSADASE